MTPPFNLLERISRDATADARNLADVAAHEAKRREPDVSPWWWVAIGAVLVVWVGLMGVAARLVWECVG